MEDLADFATVLVLMCFLGDNFGFRTSFSSWSLRNLPKTVVLFIWAWKVSFAKSTGFRIQLLPTENERYQKSAPLLTLPKTIEFFLHSFERSSRYR